MNEVRFVGFSLQSAVKLSFLAYEVAAIRRSCSNIQDCVLFQGRAAIPLYAKLSLLHSECRSLS